MKNKNGKIELLRFIFAILILLRHIDLKVYNLEWEIGGFTLGMNGYMGVEFFFLICRFFMARSIYKKTQSEGKTEHLGSDTTKYILNKIKGFWNYHLIFCGIMCVVVCILAPDRIPWKLIAKLPSVLFLQNTGLLGKSSALIAMEWYISSMLIALCIIYPLARNNYDKFTHIIAPFSSIMILGYLVKFTGYFSGTTAMLGFTMKSNYRAFAVISLGMVCYEVYRYLINLKDIKNKYRLFAIIETICYVLSILYMVSNLSNAYETHCLILLCIAVTLSFVTSEIKGDKSLFNNKLNYFLGAITLPVYLSQEIVWELVIVYMKNCSKVMQSGTIVVCTFVLALLVYFIVNKFSKNKNEKLV